MKAAAGAAIVGKRRQTGSAATAENISVAANKAKAAKYGSGKNKTTDDHDDGGGEVVAVADAKQWGTSSNKKVATATTV